MKVLITGGAGFIGSATAEALSAAGHTVTVLDTFSEQIHGDAEQARATEERVARSAEVVRGDVRDRSVLDELVPRSDVVVHLAAETGTGQSMYDITHHTDVNVGGTAALLETLTTVPHEVRRVVVASSRVDLRRGQLPVPHRRHRAPPGPHHQPRPLRPGLPRVRRPGGDGADRRVGRAQPGLGVRRDQAGAGEPRARRRPRPRPVGVRPALPERLRARAVAEQPLHRHPRRVRARDARRAPHRDLRGRAGVARLRARRRRRGGQRRRRDLPAGRGGLGQHRDRARRVGERGRPPARARARLLRGHPGVGALAVGRHPAQRRRHRARAAHVRLRAAGRRRARGSPSSAGGRAACSRSRAPRTRPATSPRCRSWSRGASCRRPAPASPPAAEAAAGGRQPARRPASEVSATGAGSTTS